MYMNNDKQQNEFEYKSGNRVHESHVEQSTNETTHRTKVDLRWCAFPCLGLHKWRYEYINTMLVDVGGVTRDNWNQNQNSLLVIRQIDNPSPGLMINKY